MQPVAIEKAFLLNRKILAASAIALSVFSIICVIYQIFSYDTVIKPYLHILYPACTTNNVSGINVLSYFTTLSNILASIFLLVAYLKEWGVNLFAEANENPAIQCAVTVYMAVTGIVFCVGLLPFRQEYPWDMPVWFNNIIVYLQHIVMPVVITVIWFFPRTEKKISRRAIWSIMLFPFAYLVFSLIRGELMTVPFYPYPFLNVRQEWSYIGHGYPFIPVIAYTIMIAILAGICVFFVGVSRLMIFIHNERVEQESIFNPDFYGFDDLSDSEELQAENEA